jgi:hypothetical protein
MRQWNCVERNEIASLLNRGLTAAQIALRYEGRTRASIIGLVNRDESLRKIGFRHTMDWSHKVVEDYQERRTAAEARRRQGISNFRKRGMPEWAMSILADVCDRHGVCPSDVAGHTRFRPLVQARNEAMYLVKSKKPSLTNSQIGRWFGRDNTTALHSMARYQEQTGAPKLVGYDIDMKRLRQAKAATASML